MNIPSQVSLRLATDEQAQLCALLEAVGQFMPRVYSSAVLDYQESRGDDSQLFGFRVYKHLRFETTTFVVSERGMDLLEPKGTYEVAIGPLRIRLDGLGHFQHEDLLVCSPDNTPSKDAVGNDNRDQMRLEMPDVALDPRQADYDLNRLTIGHFGNPLEGLVKWYFGAWTRTETDGQRWAWILPQDNSGEGTQQAPLKPRNPIVPFDQRSADAVSVAPRRIA